MIPSRSRMQDGTGIGDATIDAPRVQLAGSADPDSQRDPRHVAQTDATPPNEAQVLAARRAYYGAISYVDDQFGRLRNALASTRLADDTIIVIASDHGEMLGERGLWYKMSFFEGSVRVPLVVHAPGRFAPRRVSAGVSLIDLVADIPRPHRNPAASGRHRGALLLPHLEGRGGHDEVHAEYLAEGALAPIVMIRKGRYKFIHSPADPDQLV